MADEININRTSSEDGYDEFLNILSAAPSKEVDDANDDVEPSLIVNEGHATREINEGKDQMAVELIPIEPRVAADESSVDEAMEERNSDDRVNISTGEPASPPAVQFVNLCSSTCIAVTGLLLPMFRWYSAMENYAEAHQSC
eukprot:scaffold15300_cov23-Cyclotella_meneghiniana.AAC.1